MVYRKPSKEQREMSEAIFKNDIKKVYELLKDGFDAGKRRPDDQGWTPAHEAASMGRVTILTMFFECGVSWKVHTKEGRSLYNVASVGGRRATEGIIMARQNVDDRIELDKSDRELLKSERERILKYKRISKKTTWPQHVVDLISDRFERGMREEAEIVIDLLSNKTKKGILELPFYTEAQKKEMRKLLRIAG